MSAAEPRADLRVAVTVIGDAFADLLCYLDPSDDVPKAGGDARLAEPIQTAPGGSGLNTATHLRALARDFVEEGSEGRGGRSTATMEVELQTVLNERDGYGRLLLDHANRHGVKLTNRLPSSRAGDDSSSSTGHCAVIVSNGERSFLTHRGCVGEFYASMIDADGIVGCVSTATTRGGEVGGGAGAEAGRRCHHHRHVHVAGYYNIPGFWDGRLREVLSSALEGRRETSGGGGGDNGEGSVHAGTIAAMTTMTVSLVPQHDATEQWDGGLLDLLPLVDFLILSELEARSIFRRHCAGVGSSAEGGNDDAEADDGLLRRMARFFHSINPDTWVVVTRGPRGAVAMLGGTVRLTQDAPVAVERPADPTGAGDAFAAGFLYGALECFRRWRQDGGGGSGGEGEREGEKGEWRESAVGDGLRWGCAVGTGCVSRRGAGVPAPKDEVEALLRRVRAAPTCRN